MNNGSMRSDDAKNYLMMQRTTALSQGKHSVKFDQPTPAKNWFYLALDLRPNKKSLCVSGNKSENVR